MIEGWTHLINATKWHYFRDAKSLCNRWMYLGSTFEQGDDDSADNCRACRAKLIRERVA